MPSRGGDRGERRGRHRAAVADAELRRRLRVLGARLPVGAVPHGLRRRTRSCTRRRRASRSPQAMLDRAKPYLQRHRAATTRWYYARRSAGRSRRTRCTRASSSATSTSRRAQKLLAEAGGVDEAVDGGERLAARRCSRGNKAAADGAQGDRAPRAEQGVSETAGAANFTTELRRRRYLLLASDRRVDAVMLESLIQEQKDLDLIPKVVTGLLAHRKAGRWLNTQENTFALLALDLYFQTVREGDAGLRRARVARQRLRRRPRVQGPHDRLLRDRDPDEGRRDARQAGPDDPEGRQGPALLPRSA